MISVLSEIPNTADSRRVRSLSSCSCYSVESILFISSEPFNQGVLMARKREGSIKESLPRLRTLEKRCAGESAEQRVRMLLLLKQEPTRTMDDVAATIGCTPRTIKRWWKLYQEEGISSLIDLPGSPAGIRQSAGNRSGSSQRLTRTRPDTTDPGPKKGHRRETVTAEESRITVEGDDALNDTHSSILWGRLLRLLADLPTMATIAEKNNAVRDTIQELFDDVDKATVVINGSCDVLRPETYQAKIFVMDLPMDGTNRTIDVGHGKESHVGRVLLRLQSIKYRFDLYQEPHGIEYFYRGKAYLGVILLWTRRNRPALSRKTVAMMEQLEPFWISVFASAAAIHQLQNPIDDVFGKALTRLVKQFKLSEQERRVIILRLLGQSYKEMAETLVLSIDTIKHHLKSVYNKTGTGSHAELFARFFTPKGDIDGDFDK